MMARHAFDQPRIARSTVRTHLFLTATIRFGRVSAAIRLRDLSVSGARVEGAALPAIGTTAHISRGSLQMIGTIVWREGKACGIRFDDPLPIEEWLPTQIAHDQMAIDEMVDNVRSGRPRSATPPPTSRSKEPVRDLLPQRLAEELAYVCRLLEHLGDDLCADPLLVMRHADKLQNLDLSAQILGHVAALLVTDRPDQAIKSIGMTSLRNRLQRVSL